MTAPISRSFYDVLAPPDRRGRGGRAQEYVDLLREDGTIFQTIRVGSPAPVATVREAVDRANGEVAAEGERSR